MHILLCAGHYSCLCVPYTVMYFLLMCVCPFGAGHILLFIMKKKKKKLKNNSLLVLVMNVGIELLLRLV